MARPLISVRRLVKSYGPLDALAGIDLTLESGGIIGLLGPNGAGKTTLVEILEGLRKPTRGEVRIFGLDPSRSSSEILERIGVQLQATPLPNSLTVCEAIDLFGSFYRRRATGAEILKRIDLEAKACARIDTLSGGQRQRLAVGLALVHDPELILLDEPTTGLDPAARRGLHAVIRSLRDEGRTILLTTHYIEEAETLCDRVVVLRAGRIVADGRPFDLLGRARGRSTVWLAVKGDFDPLPLIWAGAEPRGREGAHQRFEIDDPTRLIIALGKLLQEGGIELTDLRLRRPTLEDVYLELVGEDQPAGEDQSTRDCRAPAGTPPGASTTPSRPEDRP